MRKAAGKAGTAFHGQKGREWWVEAVGDRGDDKSVILAQRGQLALEEMLKRAGGVLSAHQVAELLSTAPASVLEKADREELLAITHDGQRQYPSFQFINGRVIPHLPEILALLGTSSDIAKLRFFVTEDADLGENAFAALRHGRSFELAKRKARQFGHQLAR